MATVVPDEHILPILTRYIDNYHWSFNMAARIINMYYGTVYTQKKLKALYQKGAKS